MASKSANDGYIFVNYWSTFIFFIPFNIVYMFIKIRKKQIDFMTILLISNVLYIIIALILKKFGIVARYYVMKPYYMLWLVMLVITAKLIINLLNENIEKIYKIIINIAFFTYTTLLVIYTISGPLSIKIFEREKESIHSMYNIFRINRGIILHENFEIIYTKDELNLLKEEVQKFEDNAKIIYLEDGLNKEWLRRILLKNNDYESYCATLSDLRKEKGIEKYILDTNEKVYIICYRNTFIKKYYNEVIQKIYDNTKIVAEKEKLIIFTNK